MPVLRTNRASDKGICPSRAPIPAWSSPAAVPQVSFWDDERRRLRGPPPANSPAGGARAPLHATLAADVAVEVATLTLEGVRGNLRLLPRAELPASLPTSAADDPAEGAAAPSSGGRQVASHVAALRVQLAAERLQLDSHLEGAAYPVVLASARRTSRSAQAEGGI